MSQSLPGRLFVYVCMSLSCCLVSTMSHGILLHLTACSRPLIFSANIIPCLALTWLFCVLKGPYHNQLTSNILKTLFCGFQRHTGCPYLIFDSPRIKQKLSTSVASKNCYLEQYLEYKSSYPEQ